MRGRPTQSGDWSAGSTSLTDCTHVCTYIHYVLRVVPWAYRTPRGLTTPAIKATRLVRLFSGALLLHMGSAYFAAHRAPRAFPAPAVTRQVSAPTHSDGGAFHGLSRAPYHPAFTVAEP